MELRKENQRIMMLQGNSMRGRVTVDHSSDLRARYPTICFMCLHKKYHYCLSVGWHIGYNNSSCSLNTDLQREVSSGPDGSQSGIWRQRSIRLRLRSWRGRWRHWKKVQGDIEKKWETETAPWRGRRYANAVMCFSYFTVLSGTIYATKHFKD